MVQEGSVTVARGSGWSGCWLLAVASPSLPFLCAACPAAAGLNEASDLLVAAILACFAIRRSPAHESNEVELPCKRVCLGCPFVSRRPITSSLFSPMSNRATLIARIG